MRKQLTSRRIDPLTAAGALFIIIGGTALTTYLALIVPGRLAAQQGPPEAFLLAATEQARSVPPGTPSADDATTAPGGVRPTPTFAPTPSPIPNSTLNPTYVARTTGVAPGSGEQPAAQEEGGGITFPLPDDNEFGDWPLPDYVEVRYWLSITSIGLEAPIITLTPREREINGRTVLRLPVPNSYSVGWDGTSAEPGLAGNTALTGHNNFYGGVFQDLQNIAYGTQIAVWSERGVFNYTVSTIEYIEETGQSLEVRLNNAHWLNETADDRVAIITCWPNDSSISHRLIVVATR
ncbi:MAG: sortase domain-bontaining protein [Anaerolineae bacterium]